MIKAILACDDDWGIGKDGDLPWPRNHEDLKWFKECTNAHAVVMGRKTWESLPIKPLPNRLNFVISSTNMGCQYPQPHGWYATSKTSNVRATVKDIIEARYDFCDDVWIIGGGQLVEACLPIIEEIWLSRISGTYNCDIFLPGKKIEDEFPHMKLTVMQSGLNIQRWSK